MTTVNKVITLKDTSTYYIEVDVDYTNFCDETSMEINSITYHCKETFKSLDITDMLYDFLDNDLINDMEQDIWEHLTDK